MTSRDAMPCSHLPPADVPDPLRVEDAHLTETVLLLAHGIAADLGFDRLPILADSLEDAGCDNFTLLNHLRSDEPHRVECWALRRLLRTTLMLPGNVPITFACCPPGAFEMGSMYETADVDEKPVRWVTITHPLQFGIYPVTQEQWRAVMGTPPSFHQGDHRPVERVTWTDATAFCTRTAEFTGRPVRLPTEAEWEYACRAGTRTEYHYGDEPSVASMNCFETLGEGRTTTVGGYSPNPWGLFDMHGNVMEWCQDWYDDKFYAEGGAVDPVCRVPGGYPDEAHRCVRGGCWRYFAGLCRSALRNYRSPTEAENYLGFRVVFTAT